MKTFTQTSLATGLLAFSLAACNSNKSAPKTIAPGETPVAAAPADAAAAPAATPVATSTDAQATPTPSPIDEPAAGASVSDEKEKMKGQSSAIEGAWHSECADAGKGLSAMSTYTYKDGTETLKTETFSGASCQDAFMATVQTNIVIVGETVEGLPNTHSLIRTRGRTEATPFTEAAIQSLQGGTTGNAAASSVEWSLGQAKDVSKSDEVGRVERALVKLEDGKLFFGTLDEQGTPKFGAGLVKLAQFESQFE